MTNKDLILKKLIEDNPQFHSHQGKLISWAIHPDTLRFLYSTLKPEMSTLETGCGHTTVVFSLMGTRHTCITCKGDEAERIKKYCEDSGLKNNINFIIGNSESILPTNEPVLDELDYVFIDGAHYFPIPVIDWFYTARKLKIGGILGLDDFEMPSVRILYDFLNIEEEWQLLKTLNRTAFFKKVNNMKIGWGEQKINEVIKNNKRYSRTISLITGAYRYLVD